MPELLPLDRTSVKSEIVRNGPERKFETPLFMEINFRILTTIYFFIKNQNPNFPYEIVQTRTSTLDSKLSIKVGNTLVRQS